MAGFMTSALKALGLKKDSGAPTDSMDLNEFLAEIAKLSGFDLDFSPSETAEGTVFEITGADAEEFLGDSSEMLEALAHISMRFQRRKAGVSNEPGAQESTSEFRISFDAGNFRERKTQDLRDLAESKRQKVIEAGGKPSYINALGPAERKVIHTYITSTGDVVSESIGSGYFKRIRIRLKDDTRTEAGPRSGNGGGGRGPRRDGGGGGNGGGGRGPRRGGGNGGGGRSNNGGNGGNGGGNRNYGNNDAAREANGNVVRPEGSAREVDDNIGNRLKPGEESAFTFDSHDNDNDSSKS
ncbi:MAG: R3H domain-containing nucleic acid-binding protein [Bdellovibrionota bacterium]